MKKLIIISILSIGLLANLSAQWPSTWENFDPQVHNSLIVPASAVADQFANAHPAMNCHGYSMFVAMGIPLPPPFPNGVNYAIPNSYIQNMYLAGKIKFGSGFGHSNPTHVGWFTAGTQEFNGIQHSALLSQFDAFPASQGYVQGTNTAFSPGTLLNIHKISDYSAQYPSFEVRYFTVDGTAIPPNYQPITPSSIFSCEAYVVSEPDCNRGINGEAAVVNSITTNTSTHTWLWSNNVATPENLTLTSGTHSVTVTESPSNYKCVSTVSLNDQTSFFSHFSYTVHDQNYGCINGYQGTGTATVNVHRGYSINDFTFNWDSNTGNQQNVTATGLCNQTFSVTITSNITGCSETHIASVPLGSSGPSMGRKKNNSSSLSNNLNEEEYSQIKIFPNPAKNVLNIEGLLVNSKIIITDINGRIVLEEKANMKNSINTSDLSRGIYILSVSDNEGKILNEKIILD